MIRGISVFLVFLMLSVVCKAQVTPLYPDIPATYSFNMPLVSPAYIPEGGKFFLGSIYKFKARESNLAIFDINAAVVWDGLSRNKQLIRFSFSNEKEGPYISTPRAAVNYAYRLALANEIFLSAGISLGFVNRIYSAPTSTSQGNIFLPDGNIGLKITYKEFQIGGSVMQFLNFEASPFQSKQQLKSFYHLYGTYKHNLNAFWSLKEYVLLKVLPEVTTQFIGGVNIVYQDLYEVGISYYQRRGMTFQFIWGFGNDNYPLAISMAYNSSLFSKSPLWVDAFELGLKMIINQSEKVDLSTTKSFNR
jgi:hypothetical protein